MTIALKTLSAFLAVIDNAGYYQEKPLFDYSLQAAKLHCQLSTKATRKLDYQYAVAMRPSKNIPELWRKNLQCESKKKSPLRFSEFFSFLTVGNF